MKNYILGVLLTCIIILFTLVFLTPKERTYVSHPFDYTMEVSKAGYYFYQDGHYVGFVPIGEKIDSLIINDNL
jgi:hypothetical protein